MTEFPAEVYSGAQKKWLGKDHIVTPSIKNALNGLQLIQGKVVLDGGCGQGTYSQQLLDWGASFVYATDQSEEMINSCKQTFQESSTLHFLHQPLQQLELPRKVDVALSIYVLQFIHEKSELKTAIENIFDCLTDDGILIAAVPNGSADFCPSEEDGKKFGASIELSSKKSLEDGDVLRVNFYDNNEVIGHSEVAIYFRETYEKLLKEAGFKTVEFISPIISQEGLKLYGEEFFHSFLTPPKDIFIRASKN